MFLLLIVIGDETAEKVDAEVGDAAVARMFSIWEMVLS